MSRTDSERRTVELADVLRAIHDEPEYPDAERFTKNVTAGMKKYYGVDDILAQAMTELIVECARISVRETKAGIMDRVLNIQL